MSDLTDDHAVADMFSGEQSSSNHGNPGGNRGAAIKEKEAIREPLAKKAYYKPTAENAAKAKALINFLMHDKFFLALLRSNDPKVRTAALDELNKAHFQAYGDSPMDAVQAS